ncbi:hypothetical protein TVAG_505020 [Trichomonas vaginalis G3]|uniref:Uncharacterized protein n=1 Tax=Trichomonas vaginalis (strain ATCC PRA-98 / G3) TaxID=412133 RepID=A2GB66_TRIV3|nr:microtubule binding [Trichomonas vaginalis G3]EAX85599.1 hypothetical protein TVAG_505020 [Trichomonas vaginalis G3]KAI5535916.1 microtubule binding [Trichomonas vaginalis G3]|eukprot:XP_001298529.1 hypothetical protein [Trichomonas vaginalis G3]
MAVDHFNMLGIPEAERGDYAVLGDDDYSRERLERLKLKVEDLQHEIEEKRLVADDIKNEIYSIQKELSSKLSDQEEAVLNSPLLTPGVIDGIRNLLERLQQVKAHRVKEFEEIALNITHLWDTLNISDSYRKAFLEKYATISDEVYEGCMKELAKLQKQMDEKLPTLIKAHREQLAELYDFFHIPPEGRLMVDENCETGQEAVKIFQQMNDEIVRLKKLKVKLNDLVKLVTQAEQIKKDYDDVLKNHDPKNYTARDTDSAKILVFEERARRRYKVTLPSLIDKLKRMLDKFRKDNGYDFEWDGRPYIEKLKEDEQQEAIEKKFAGKITDCGSVPPIKRKGKKGDDLYHNENMNDNRGNSVRTARRQAYV